MPLTAKLSRKAMLDGLSGFLGRVGMPTDNPCISSSTMVPRTPLLTTATPGLGTGYGGKGHVKGRGTTSVPALQLEVDRIRRELARLVSVEN